MKITYADALGLKQELEPDYQGRHDDHSRLRKFWHGKYDETWSSVGLDSVFRDISRTRNDVGPDFTLVRNILFDVCVKYQSYLSTLPMIRVPNGRPTSRTAKAQAELKEDVIYGTWEQANMKRALNQSGWFGPLMGDSFLGIWPDFGTDGKGPYGVKALVRSPEWAFPVPAFDGVGLDAIIFCWKTPAGRVKRQFPDWNGDGPSNEGSKNVEILEYSDTACFYRWIDGQLVNGVEHNLGFNLFDQVGFIEVPGEPWNHGAVEQSVGMVQAGNALYSLMMQSVIENVFPKLILKNPMKFGETIDTSAGAVIAVNEGGDAYYLNPPNGTTAAGLEMLQETERSIKQDTSMPDVSFGQFDASIITGKAVNALQGAGTGSLVEMVQGGGIGTALSNWNAKALAVYKRLFPDDKIHLGGFRPESILDLNPREFAVSFKGREIVGSPKNEVVFSPYIDQHGKLVMALQAQGAGLVSKQWSREQIGISDSLAMNEEIVSEVLDEAIVGAIVADLQADPTPQHADQAAAKATAYYEAAPMPVTAPHPLLAPGGQPTAPGGMPVGDFSGPGAGGQFKVPALPLPPGSPAPQVGAPPQAAPQAPASAPAGVTLQQAQDALTGVQLQGRAFLVGEIVAAGSTTDAVEIAVTDPADRQALQDAASFPVAFHVVDGEPNEQYVELGTGQAGGQAPTAESLLAA